MSNKRRLDRSAIINAAAALAEESGLDHLTLNQVADKLGVKTPSLYNHVSGLDALTSELARFAMRRLEEAGRDAAVGRSGADALKAIAAAYRKFAGKNPQLYQAVMKYHSYRGQDVMESGQSLMRVLYQVMEPYQYGKDDTVHFVRGFRSALHGFVSLEEAGFFQAAPEADASYDRMVSGFISILERQKGL